MRRDWKWAAEPSTQSNNEQRDTERRCGVRCLGSLIHDMKWQGKGQINWIFLNVPDQEVCDLQFDGQVIQQQIWGVKNISRRIKCLFCSWNVQGNKWRWEGQSKYNVVWEETSWQQKCDCKDFREMPDSTPVQSSLASLGLVLSWTVAFSLVPVSQWLLRGIWSYQVGGF